MERAGFWIRAVALVLDGIIVGIIEWIISAVLGANENPYSLASLSVSLIIALAYYVWFQTFNKGQTIGKKITGIRVSNLDGEPVGYGTMFLREIVGKLLSALTLLIGYIMAANSKKRALHDYIARTIVIRSE